VLLMERCPSGPSSRLEIRGLSDPVLASALGISVVAAIGILALAACGPESLRPALVGLSLLVLLMALGALFGSRRIWLCVSIVNNLALLLFFKYAGFLVENVNALLAWFHLGMSLPEPATWMPLGMAYVLPAGISFYTFQSLSYTIDFYLGNVPREKNILRFATFVCFYPQLMAGPIERARQLLPQYQAFPQVRLQNFTDGASLFLVGLFKKLALSNYLAHYVERVYARPADFDAPALILATFAFAWQIYCDFSGYTDMARGVAKVMGFNLVLNFRNPYLATGIGEFWNRWHISLSSWFRDYVYIPLGGNRCGRLLMVRNLLVTFVISGVWHGASWTFLIWGLLHGLGVVLTRDIERSSWYQERVPKLVKQLAVFLFVSFAWIFFRARTLDDAWLIIGRICTTAWCDPQVPTLMLALVGLVWLYAYLYESNWRGLLKFAPLKVAVAVCMILYLGLCSSGGGSFIYFQF